MVLYEVNQGQIPLGECVDEQLATMGIKPSDLDAMLLTHLDCDHANGLVQVKDAIINNPGHVDGLYAVTVSADDGRFVLLFSDGGYARKSWEKRITSDIAADKEKQKASLAWIREQSLDPCAWSRLPTTTPTSSLTLSSSKGDADAKR